MNSVTFSKMDNRNKPSHGGARPGAGRPSRHGPSKVIRLPVSLIPAVQSLLTSCDFPDGAILPPPVASRTLRPLLGHKVQAGFPSPADDYVEAWLDLNEHLIVHKDATFFVQATGDSMTGAGIQEGNLLVVDRALEARHGDIVIAVIDGELTVKRLEKRRGKIRLVAENPAFSPIEFKDGQELTIWGVVTSVIQKIKR